MNCKPGDYATITQSATGNVGKVVQCVALAPSAWSERSEPRWIIEAPLLDNQGRLVYSVPDAALLSAGPLFGPGRALILVGPAGCGKSSLSDMLTVGRSTFCVDAMMLDDQFPRWLRNGAEFIRVEGLPSREVWAKHVGPPRLVLEHLLLHKREVTAPFFIFSTDDAVSAEAIRAHFPGVTLLYFGARP